MYALFWYTTLCKSCYLVSLAYGSRQNVVSRFEALSEVTAAGIAAFASDDVNRKVCCCEQVISVLHAYCLDEIRWCLSAFCQHLAVEVYSTHEQSLRKHVYSVVVVCDVFFYNAYCFLTECVVWSRCVFVVGDDAAIQLLAFLLYESIEEKSTCNQSYTENYVGMLVNQSKTT